MRFIAATMFWTRDKHADYGYVFRKSDGILVMANQKHGHGSMSTDDQEKTFASFVGVVSKSVVVIAVALVLLYLING